MEKKENFEIDLKEKKVLLKINPKIYPLDIIYTTCYVFLDKFYIFLDGNPENEILVSLKLKEKNKDYNLEKLAGEFFNELLNYSFYKKQSEKNQKIRETLLEAALIGCLRNAEEKIEESDDINEISKTWEEKYGLNKNDSS